MSPPSSPALLFFNKAKEDQTDPFRLSFIHLPSSTSKPAPKRPLLSTLLHDSLHNPTLASASPATLLQLIDKAELGPGGDSTAQTAGEIATARAYWAEGTRFGDALGLADGALGLVINGRVSRLCSVFSLG